VISLMREHKARLLKLVQNLVGSAILIGFVAYLWSNRTLFTEVSRFTLTDVFLCALLIVATWVTTSAQSYVLFRASQCNIRFFECVVLTVASIFGNHIPMRIGTVARIHYMQRMHQLDYVTFVSISSVRLVLTMISAGALGLAAVLTMVYQGSPLSLELLAMFIAFTVGPSLIYVFAPKSLEFGGTNVFLKVINKLIGGIHNLKQRPTVGLFCLGLIFFQHLLTGARFMLVAYLIGQPLEPSTAAVLVSVTAISNFLAITPGGVGVRESVMGYATLATGANFTQGLMTGAVDRVILLALVALLGGASFLTIWIKLNKVSTRIS